MENRKLHWYGKLMNWCRKHNLNRFILDRDGVSIYLERFYLLPRGLFLGLMRVVMHKFHKSDDPSEPLHSHKWAFWFTYILEGGYLEHTLQGTFERKPGDFVIRSGKSFHRVELYKDENGNEKSCITIFGMGPKFGRTWGFLDEETKKEIPYDIYLKNRAKV